MSEKKIAEKKNTLTQQVLSILDIEWVPLPAFTNEH